MRKRKAHDQRSFFIICAQNARGSRNGSAPTLDMCCGLGTDMVSLGKFTLVGLCVYPAVPGGD